MACGSPQVARSGSAGEFPLRNGTAAEPVLWIMLDMVDEALDSAMSRRHPFKLNRLAEGRESEAVGFPGPFYLSSC